MFLAANWTAIRNNKSSNANLAMVGRKLGLGQCVQQSITNRVELSDKIMATAVEGVIGAVYLDTGKNLAAIESVMVTMGILKKAD